MIRRIIWLRLILEIDPLLRETNLEIDEWRRIFCLLQVKTGSNNGERKRERERDNSLKIKFQTQIPDVNNVHSAKFLRETSSLFHTKQCQRLVCHYWPTSCQLSALCYLLHERNNNNNNYVLEAVQVNIKQRVTIIVSIQLLLSAMINDSWTNYWQTCGRW